MNAVRHNPTSPYVITRGAYTAQDVFHQAVADIAIEKGLLIIQEEPEEAESRAGARQRETDHSPTDGAGERRRSYED